MSEVNNEDKQGINNIKSLYKMNGENVIPNLFHEVKRAKQQAFVTIGNLRDYLQQKKKQKEEAQKQLVKEQTSIEVLEHVSPIEKKVKKAKEEEKSFAELFASSLGEEVKSKDEVKGEEKTKEASQPIVEVKKEEKVEKKVEQVIVEKKTEKVLEKAIPQQAITNTNVQKQNQMGQTNFNTSINLNQSANNTSNVRQFTPKYNNERPNNFSGQGNNSFARNNNFQGQNNFGFNRNNYQGQNNGGFNRNNNFGNRNFANNQCNNQNSQNGFNNNFRKPYVPNSNRFGANGGQGFGNNQRQQNGQNGFQRRPFNANGQKSGFVPANPQNRALMGIIPKKTNTLASAASVFATKERSFGNKKKTSERPEDEKKINKKSLIRRGLIEEQDIEERMVARKLKLKRSKVDVAPVVSAPVTNAVITTPNLTVKILSEKIGKPVTEIIKQLMVLGIMTTINSPIDFQTAELVSSELGVEIELKLEKTFEERLKENALIDDGNNNEKRAPIVTIVGHVDHGKTSLLDYIRKTHVTSREAGGITQTIGAYSINWKGENITFVDTPGHEAFINMRKRGTEITDVAVLIVAADDGVKPQTVEAIKHVKEAKVPMIVAITKIDKQDVNIERIKQQLTEYEILPEEWGGDTIIVPVSSVTGEGIDKLLEMILLVAEMQNLSCNTKRSAVGTVIEAELDKNKGPVANIIVQNGTLKVGDCVVSGFAFGKIRAMSNDKGKSIMKAGPSTPVSILGLDNVPNAGDTIQVVDEKFSKQVIEERKNKIAQEKMENGGLKSLDEFLATPVHEDKKVLSLLLKANSQGSVEALKQSLLEIKNDEVRVEVVSSGVGNINENDIQLAKVSNALIITFDTKVLAKISNFAKQNKVEIREYDIIYKAIEDIEKLMKSMMAPKYQEKVVGHAEVRALFKISSVGTIAGCYVLDGKILRNAQVRVLRNDKVIYDGKIATLKREKDDVKEVAFGYECGIKVEGFNDVLEGDKLECFVQEQINL